MRLITAIKLPLIVLSILSTVLSSAQDIKTIIRPNDSTTGRSAFGYAVAIRGDWAVGSAILKDSTIYAEGAVYVFHKSDSGWVQHQKLIPPPDTRGSRYGGDCRITDSFIFIADPYPRVGDTTGNGYIHIFKLIGNQWVYHQWIREANSPYRTGLAKRIDVYDDVLVAGFPDDATGAIGAGSILIYRYSPFKDKWIKEKILRPDTIAAQGFGFAVAVIRDRIFVSSDKKVPGVKYAGSVSIYNYRHQDWIPGQVIGNPFKGPTANGFGWQLDAYDSTLAVSAIYEDDSLVKYGGSVYIYKDRSGYQFEKKFIEPQPNIDSHMGTGIGLYNDMAVIGDHSYAAGTGRGFYIEDVLADSATVKQLFCPNNAYSFMYGTDVDVHGNQAILGAPAYSNPFHYPFAHILEWCGLPVIGGMKDRYCVGDSIHLFAGCEQDSAVWHKRQGIIGIGNKIHLRATVSDTVWLELFSGMDLHGYDTISYEVVPDPVPTFTSDTTCLGDSVTFTNVSNAATGSLYYWDFDDDGVEDDTTSGDTRYFYPSAGTYPVYLDIVTKGCMAHYAGNVVVENCVGIEKTETPSIRIYPNPATRQVTVEMPSADFEWMVVYNSMGAEMQTVDVSRLGTVHLRTDWPAGIYFVTLRSESRIWTQRIVVSLP